MNTVVWSGRTALFGILAVLSFAAAAQTALVQGNGVQINPVDIQSEALRVPLEQRKEVMSDPKNVTQAAQNLFIRRSLARQAEANGLDRDPVTQAALQIARERVLSDAQLARHDAAVRIDDAALDAYAENMYKAEPKRFDRPEEVSVRHILIRTETEGAKAKAEQLLAQLKAGADFAKLARENSQDSGTASNGGDLGAVPRGRTVPEFEQAAFALRTPGELSGVVQTSFGYHIIKLEGRRAAGMMPYAEVKDALRDEAKQRILAERRATMVQRLLDAGKFNEDAIKQFSASQR
jgi:peptidyl-prolyl cis-trans isomerase C